MRAIISQVGTVISVAFTFVDHYLYKFLPYMPTFCKNSTSLANYIKKLFTPYDTTYLSTLDTKGMYFNVDTE